MEQTIASYMSDLHSLDRQAKNVAYEALLAFTEGRVDWAYDVWEQLMQDLTHADNHVRTIAAQLLCNMAISDPDHRLLRDLPALLEVTRDKKFVTARHTVQALWKIGRGGPKHRQALLSCLQQRYVECGVEKNGTLLRFDILQGLRKLYDETNDNEIPQQALAWIELE